MGFVPNDIFVLLTTSGDWTWGQRRSLACCVHWIGGRGLRHKGSMPWCAHCWWGKIDWGLRDLCLVCSLREGNGVCALGDL